MTSFIIIFFATIILIFLFKKKYIPESTITKIIEENYNSILNLAENERIISSYVNLDIEEGGHYPRFFHRKHIQIVKSAIRNYITDNPNLKIENDTYLFSNFQKQEILRNCITMLKD
jgi:hypothetical protein